MNQVLAIHGGNSFASYEEFIADLLQKVVRLEFPSQLGWRSNLPAVLGEEYEVILPRMPNGEYAKYLEWKIWFEKHIPYLRDGVVLVGHSLGAVFLAKYLSEEAPLPMHIGSVHLVAPPFDSDDGRRLVEFDITNDLVGLSVQVERIFLYHSSDDPVVPFAELEKFRALLPHATVRTFTDRQHFNQPEFPELVDDIRSLR
ncbi:MAG: alpha/beta hydrolase [Bacillota bacterium]